jgi:hypothetical protein
MGYMHIDNLYKALDILLFRECFALEKIHGTSAHVSWSNGELHFFAGGCKHETFVALFDAAALASRFTELGHASVTVFGEAYGGKLQGMSHTYGKVLRFAVFDVRVGEESWLSVPDAEDVAKVLGLPFVHYRKISTGLEALIAERDSPSIEACRCGIVEPRPREGVVLRPLIELRKNNGQRIIVKFKGEAFNECASPKEVDPAKRQVLEDAEAVALEWVTDNRLGHVLDKLGNPRDLSKCPDVIKAMIEDVSREGAGEIPDPASDKDVRKAISGRAIKLYKALVTKVD